MVILSKLIKKYITWDVEAPLSGMVMCHNFTTNGLHTFYGMLGYLMKDLDEDHFQTIDCSISIVDLTSKCSLECNITTYHLDSQLVI